MQINDSAPMSARDILVDLDEQDLTKSVTFAVEDRKPTGNSDTEKPTKRPKRRTKTHKDNEQFAALTEKVERTNEQLNEFLSTQQVKQHSDKVESLKSDIRQATEDWRKAKRDEDVDAEAVLFDRLTDLKADLKLAERDAESAASKAKEKPEPTGTPEVPRLARDFMAENPQLFRNPAYAEELEIVRAIDRSLNAEGVYTPDEEDYYEELLSRVQRRLPELSINRPDWMAEAEETEVEQQIDKRPDRRSPTQSAGAQTKNSRVRNNKVTLTRDDLAIMRGLGLDPDNPKEVRAYAQEVAKQAARNS